MLLQDFCRRVDRLFESVELMKINNELNVLVTPVDIMNYFC